MPKNIYLPKENIIKTEEIREIENQVPSYEEFVSNYQQEQVDYSDLTYIDISSNKTFGPMPRAWAEQNANERFTPLKISCPSEGCPNPIIANQTHTCGGSIEVSNLARIKCSVCGATGKVREWNFSCSSHNGNYYSSASGTDINVFKRALFRALSEGDRKSVV